MKRSKVAIIGAGSISHHHARAYGKLPQVELAAVCDIDNARAKEFARKYGVAHVFTDYDELLRKSDIDAVSVTTWNNVHAPASIAALRAGKHVLCEKPMALNAREGREMTAEAEKAGKLLMVGFVRRFGENTRALKTMIDAGHLGPIYAAKVGYVRRWGNPGGWFADKKRSGGGALIDLGVHIIDLARYLAGSPRPVAAFAATTNKHGMKPHVRGVDKYRTADYDDFCDVEDGATALVRFDSGMTLFVETTWVENTKESLYVTLQGEKAGAQLEPDFELYEDRCGYLTNVAPQLRKQDMDDMFAAELSHFIDCIGGGAQCVCPGADGLALMKILDAIYRSAETGHEALIEWGE